MTVGLQEAAKEKASWRGARQCVPRARCASARPRPRCCRFENSRLGLATNFRQVAPRLKRCKPAEGIREMPSFTVKTRWTDQTQQGGGGGSGADRVRDLVTTKAMMKGVGGGGEGLTVDQATLDQYTKGTRLEGRARIDRSLAGKEALGVTEGIGGRVRISPDAFASDALLTNVVGHEGVHVSQIVAGNFADKWASSAHNVNELEAYRQSSAAGRNFGDPAYSENWGVQMDKIAELVHDLQYTPYYKQATTWPYNYQLQSGDICSACSW